MSHRVTVETKDSYLYLKHNLPVTANLSGQFVGKPFTCAPSFDEQQLADCWPWTAQLHFCCVQVHLVISGIETASWAVYARWCMEGGLCQERKSTFNRQSVHCLLSSPTRISHLINFKQVSTILTNNKF